MQSDAQSGSQTVKRVRSALCAVAVLGAWACTAPAIPDDTLTPLDGYPTRSAKVKSDAGSTEEGTPTRGRQTEPTPPAESPPVGTDAGPSVIDAGTPVDSGSPPAATCGDRTTATACFQCCETNNPGTVDRWNNHFGICACQSPGACAASCASSFCAGVAPAIGSACDACLSQSTTCFNQADSQCLADALCAPLVQCDRASQCAAKP